MPMKRVYPDYYPDFRCVAGDCGHNCCIGWEIDINPAALRRYDGMRGAMGDRLRASIARDENGARFILDASERCPLLNKDGLCDLIIEAGEKALCQICRDHPRFRLRLRDREEMGLGLCCQEACRLILSQREPVRLILEDDGRSKAEMGRSDLRMLARRDHLIALAQDRSLSIPDRMARILEAEHAALPHVAMEQWVRVLLDLERLDDGWTEILEAGLRPGPVQADAVIQEQLLVYFLYRHCLKEWRCQDYALGAVPFCVLSTQLIAWLCREPAELSEIARMYSAEIEYSDENLAALLDMLDQYNRGEDT